jgi:hypothetical protein
MFDKLSIDMQQSDKGNPVEDRDRLKNVYIRISVYPIRIFIVKMPRELIAELRTILPKPTTRPSKIRWISKLSSTN